MVFFFFFSSGKLPHCRNKGWISKEPRLSNVKDIVPITFMGPLLTLRFCRVPFPSSLGAVGAQFMLLAVTLFHSELELGQKQDVFRLWHFIRALEEGQERVTHTLMDWFRVQNALLDPEPSQLP